MRSVAAAVLDRSLAGRLPLTGLLRDAAEPFDERDRALLRALVLGTIRWLRRIDAVLALAASRPVARIDAVLMAPLRIAVPAAVSRPGAGARGGPRGSRSGDPPDPSWWWQFCQRGAASDRSFATSRPVAGG